jgi:hypothetical protein
MSRTALDTYTLLGVKQQQKKFTPFFSMLFFPSVIEFETPEILFDKVKKGVELAPFVAPMVSGKANRKKGGVLKSLMPAYLKPTDTVNPKMLLQRRPGENLGGSLSPVERRLAVIAQLLQDQEESITHREEWMAVRAVMTGKVIVEGEDYEAQEVDYGRAAANNITLAGAAKWDTVDPDTYDPTSDIEDWAERASGTVGRLIFDKYGWRKFHGFKAVREKLDTTQRGGTSSLQLGPQLQKEVMFKGYFGEYDVWVYVGKFKEKGVDKYFMPANSLLLAPLSASDNVMGYGAIEDAKANADGIVSTSRYPSNWFSDNPSVEWLQTQSAPLPIMLDADEFVAVTLF